MTRKQTNRGACLSCGRDATDGSNRLCVACYARAWRAGIQSRWPGCGKVRVPYPYARHLGVCLSCQHKAVIGMRQLCDTCYSRAYNQGRHTNYPACGAVPVRINVQAGLGPFVPPPTFDLATLVPRIRLPWGAPQTPAWARTVAYETARAEEWLAAREQTAA